MAVNLKRVHPKADCGPECATVRYWSRHFGECEICGCEVHYFRYGSNRLTCSPRCRQAQYRARKAHRAEMAKRREAAHRAEMAKRREAGL